MQARQTAGYGFWFVLGVILVIAGLQGSFGTLLAAVFVPDALRGS